MHPLLLEKDAYFKEWRKDDIFNKKGIGVSA